MKKIKSFGLIIFGLFAISLLIFTNFAHAATSTLSLSSTGEGDNVQINATGDPNMSVILVYQKSSGGTSLSALGTTNASGNFSTTVSTASYNILPSSLVYIKINNNQSSSVSWPYNIITGGAITLSKTGLVLTVGQTAGLTVSNVGNNLLYLLSNSNPQVANINLSGSQVTVMANTYGQTVFTICVLGTTSNCASAYLTVQNSGAQALNFSQSNLTVAYNQTGTVTILNGTNNSTSNNIYSILNNSNPSVISASVNASTITLTAHNNSGTASVTVCTTDMSSCGIISVSAGSVSSTALSFNQTAPNILIGQNISVAISGGTNLNISSNSNSNIVTASINNSNNSLNLIGNSAGSSVITVCSAAGNCNSLTVTVSYVSTGGPLTLSQNSLWLQVGQSVSVIVSGGTLPYSVLNNTGTNFQASLNNNILTLTGIKAGSASLDVCSAGGACKTLSVLVNGATTSTQLTFSNNNLTLSSGNNTSVTLFGTGGYYISNSNNQNVATFTVLGDKVSVSAFSAGSASATVCQSGGQCGVIYAAVTSKEAASTPPIFSQNNPTISVGQIVNISISGGSNSSYYISSNSNPTIIQANIANKILSLNGQNIGSSVIVVCAATNNCSSLAVTVNTQSSQETTNTNNSNNANNNSNSGNTNLNDEMATKIKTESLNLAKGNLASILSNVKTSKNSSLENYGKTKYLNALTKGLKLTKVQTNNLNYFIVYGTPSTLKFGVNERAAILANYSLAYKKLPVTDLQWSDAINVVFNRLPLSLSSRAENQAKLEFKKVYSRNANLLNANDKSVIMITAYGLRPTSRNIAAEKNAIKLFKTVYRHAPVSPLAWNIVRAIAYGGVSK